ncbi:MAG TPA: class E sortase [Actinobacteria bacterium]|nr:class E sortase [Actinomycetota bacterium]
MSQTATEPTSAPSPPAPRRRLLRGLGWTLVVAGLLLLGFVFQQLVVTTWLANRANTENVARAEAYFERVPIRPAPPADTPTPPTTSETEPSPEPPPELVVEAPPPEHEPFAILRIPSIPKLAEGWAVVEGVSYRDLKNGMGHMPDTALPGQPGNAVISGHRTTYGAPFYDLDTLEPGDVIEVETALGVHTYTVRETMVVSPFDLWVTEPRPGAWLTLTTCHPRFSARQRLVVFAELTAGPNFEAIYR